MTRRTAAPFHRLDASVSVGPWMVTLGGGAPAPLHDVTPDWDYATPVRVERVVSLDLPAARSELGFADQEPISLDLIVEAGTGHGELPREVVSRSRVPLGGGAPVTISLEPDPLRLSGQLTLRTSILLSADAAPADPLAPRVAGSRLWDERFVSRLEGDDPRFPMEVISFSRTWPGRPHEEAPWLLSWNPANPGRDFHGAARLFVNADDAALIARLRDGDDLTLQAIMGDVVSQMCETALTGDWDDDLETAEAVSVAGRVIYWLGRAFGDISVARSVLENRPGEFRSAILASMRL